MLGILRLKDQVSMREDDPRRHELAERLRAFYKTVKSYPGYEAETTNELWWPLIGQRIREFIEAKGTCKVLEIGAGRSNFGQSLGPLRGSVVYHAQDIVDRNVALLQQRADDVLVGELSALNATYDVIFSTFVFEHMPEPQRALRRMLDLTGPGGSVFIVSPRYDLPFYVPPSLRRTSRANQVRVMLWLAIRRARARLGIRTEPVVHLRPAALAGEWFRDSDAVHWVSRYDLRTMIPDGWEVRRVQPNTKGVWQWFWARFMILAVELRRALPSGERKSK